MPWTLYTSKSALKQAVDEWIADEATATATHGHISGWDTSRVDDMSELFKSKTTFNAQLNWDTSKVTTMSNTFRVAEAFNSELAWDTSSVTTLYGMFYKAEACLLYTSPSPRDRG